MGVARLAIYDKDCADGYKVQGRMQKTGSVAPIIKVVNGLNGLNAGGAHLFFFCLLAQF